MRLRGTGHVLEAEVGDRPAVQGVEAKALAGRAWCIAEGDGVNVWVCILECVDDLEG
jgi:hypothetical protein